MICSHCHVETSNDSAFCDECGAALDTVCGQCREPNRAERKILQEMRPSLRRAGERAAALKPTDADPASAHVPKHLAEKILASRRFIEGERKQVTVLFADIRGSTSVIEKLDPEEVRRRFDPILHIMMDAVHRYEGTVNQVLGDGIMALFGAPLAHEDHAVRACYAALTMQEEMRRYAERLAAAIRALSKSASVSIPAKWSCARSPTTLISTTPLSAIPRIWRRAWRNWLPRERFG